ncbi:GNAT family N-acetyltransferase [Streptomyces sp. CNQ085]|uniref:GNAT family N-acetyltransferase n=1 Tax=Streptomyces sp. CNQ085 TaxID=2886944 RepID=UPI001F50B817|nr:GNAT family N-acetyltransferase [Streptomyces sp. CNQ085]MCI0386620.1 GNAT family N-acetyltransferase [Streptomyces sp. CNQ085]
MTTTSARTYGERHAVVRLPELAGADREEIRGGVPDPFEIEGLVMAWQSKQEHFGIRREGRLVAHAGLVTVPVAVAGRRTEAVGLGGVIVAPGLRGRGLARAVVTAAVDHARGMGPDLGLLFCWPERMPVYEALGWRELEEHVRVEQPDGPVTMPMRTMWTPLREGADWPPGPVRLLSLPF